MSQATRKKEQLMRLKEVSKIRHQVDELYMQGKRDGAYDTLCLLMWSLHHKSGYGQKRLSRLYNDMVYLTECVNAGLLNIDDIKESLTEECNLTIKNIK